MIIQKMKKEIQKKELKISLKIDEDIDRMIVTICDFHGFRKDEFLKTIIEENREIRKEVRKIEKIKRGEER